MTIQRIRYGERLAGIPLTSWNRGAKATEWVEREIAQLPTDPVPDAPAPYLAMMLENDTGEDREPGEVVRIEDPMIKPEETVNGAAAYQYATAIAKGIDDAQNSIAILTQGGPYLGTLPAGFARYGIMRGAIVGIVWAIVNVTDEKHNFAFPEVGQFKLQSSGQGPVAIKWKPTGTGELTCMVQVGAIDQKWFGKSIDPIPRGTTDATIQLWEPNAAGTGLEDSGKTLDKVWFVWIAQETIEADKEVIVESIAGIRHVKDAECPDDNNLVMLWDGQGGGGIWTPGTYHAGEVRTRNRWTMVANKTTTDPPDPSQENEPSYLLPASPAWTPNTQTGVSYSGHRYDINALIEIDGYRVWLPEVGPTVRHSVWFSDITDPANPVVLSSQDLTPVQTTGWAEILIPSFLVDAGTDLEVLLETAKSASSGSWSYVWQYEGTSGDTDPGSNKYTRNSAHSELYISIQDKDSIDRTADLLQLKPGDQMTLTETEQSSRYDIYSVVNVTNNTTYFTIGVTRLGNGSAIRSGKEASIAAQIYASATDSPYVTLPNYWAGVDPGGVIEGFATNDLGNIVYTDDAHGVDLRAAVLNPSPDWDIVSYSSQ